MTFEELYTIILKRKKEKQKNSYVASLFKKGKDKILQKVGEEAIEVVLAGKNESKKEIISEMADLWFHCLVLLVSLNIPFSEILKELDKRQRKNPPIEEP